MEQSGSCNDLQNTFAINENEHKNETHSNIKEIFTFSMFIIMLLYILSH